MVRETAKKETFLDGIDERMITQEIWGATNKLYGKITHMVNFKYNLLIYRLVKKGYVEIKNLEEVTGLSKQRIYKIVADFEGKEVRRQND